MTYRTMAVAAAFILIVGGVSAAATSAPDQHAVTGAPGIGAPALSTGPLPEGDGFTEPPPTPGTADLSRLTPPAPHAREVSGALGEVVDAVVDDGVAPDALADQVHVEDGRIRIEITHTDETGAREAIVAAGGRDIFQVTGGMLVADVPAGRIEGLQQDRAIVAVDLPAPISVAPTAGAAVPMTAGALGADVYSKTAIASWHKLGLTGSGVAVGVVDYFNQGAWNDAVAHAEVPAPAGTFCSSNGSACNVFGSATPSGLHGVAVSEAVHDMAPGAKIYLATVSTNEDLRRAIDYFAAHGVRILSRSLGGFYDGPGNGNGPSADLVGYAVGKGIAWFNAAGNSGAHTQTYDDGSKAWVGGYWRGAWRDTDADGWMEFATYGVDQTTGVRATTPTYSELLTIQCSPYFRLRWSDWGSSAPTDYDIYRVANGALQTPGYGANTQESAGDAPLEMQNGSSSYLRCTDGQWITVAIYAYRAGAGTSGDVLEIQGNYEDIAYAATTAYSAAEAFTDSRSTGMAGVGAVDPVAGTKIAAYSAHGPTNDGRVKPEISAGSNFTSRAYTYSGGNGRFNGTSAATPIVAGAAAVVLQRFASKTPAQLISYLRAEHTTDRGTVGVDNTYGSGELVMRAIPALAFSSKPAPAITGRAAVGATLAAKTAAWKPTVKIAYQWYRGSTAIAKATSATYKLTSADGGQKIRVRATGTRAGYAKTAVYSAWTAPVTKAFAKAPTPKITGTAKVGKTLTASVGTWSPKPTTVTYQWQRNGTAISKATKSTYKLTSSDAGKQITVTVQAKKSGYTTTSKTSAKTAKIVK